MAEARSRVTEALAAAQAAQKDENEHDMNVAKLAAAQAAQKQLIELIYAFGRLAAAQAAQKSGL